MTMANIIGAGPRPWVFTIGVDPDSELARELERLAPTLTAIDDLSLLRQVDYDAAVIVSDEGVKGLQDHLQVVWFADHGTAPVTRLDRPGPMGPPMWTYWEDGDRASRFGTTDLAAELNVASLATRLAPPSTDNDYRVMSKTNWLTEQRHPLLEEVGGKQGTLAAIYDRNKEKTSEVWCLPERALADGADWVKAALAHWRSSFPEAFPNPDWTADETWMTADEQTARLELGRHDADTAALLEVRRLERTEREVAAEEARVRADAGIRRLITTNGPPLVEAVADALHQLGFEVVDSDSVLPAGQKREDLLVQDGSWVSVTEVKGYEKGNAKQNDLLQLGSAVESYLLRTSRAPDARWYVVNQNFRTPPGLRQRPLAGAGDTITKFIAQNGLVIDTRDLFRLTRAAATGEVTPDEARRLLRGAEGVFDYPADVSEELAPEAAPDHPAPPTTAD